MHYYREIFLYVTGADFQVSMNLYHGTLYHEIGIYQEPLCLKVQLLKLIRLTGNEIRRKDKIHEQE